VMGRTGMNALEQLFLGSVSQYCCRNARCSVMVVNYDPKKYEEEIVRGKYFLQMTHLCDVISARPPITIKSTESIRTALDLLSENNISSLPVHEVAKERYIGFIDMAEIANTALEIKEEVEKEGLSDAIAQERFTQTTCHQLAVNAVDRTPLIMLNCEISLLSGIEFMNKKNLKRLAVQSDEGELLGILSQSQLLRFVLSKIHKFEFANKTVKELHLGYRDVIGLQNSATVKDAFRKLREERISGLAVLDGEKLIGNFSVSDFKFSKYANLRGYFHLTLEQFLELKPQPTTLIPTPICLRPEATIVEVMEKFRLTKVHRIYLLDENEKLMGIISLADMLQLIASEGEEATSG